MIILKSLYRACPAKLRGFRQFPLVFLTKVCILTAIICFVVRLAKLLAMTCYMKQDGKVRGNPTF
jgi:hypothetical protein